jgi:Tol biopolymer transport system component
MNLYVNKKQYVSTKLLALLAFTLIGGCSKALFVDAQVIPGGINSNFADEYPAYSSDGRYLAFASDRRGHRDIFLYDLQERNLVSLPNLNRRNSSQDRPSLSSDGRYIVYVSTERGKTDIFLYDRSKQTSELLSVNIKGSVDNPTINGDGTRVAFQASQLGQWKIVVINRERGTGNGE